MSNPWFRHYCGMMRDEKLVGVAVRSKQPVERVIWVWGAILESASEIGESGQYEFDCAEAAYFLRADESDLLSIIDGLTAAGRIISGVVAKWGDRQYISDKSVSRQAAFRERKKKNIGSVLATTENSDVTEELFFGSRYDYARSPAHIWRELRSAVFARDDYTCTYCGSRGLKLECDHIIPVSRGGPSEFSNLTTACKPCNRSKGSKDLQEWMQ